MIENAEMANFAAPRIQWLAGAQAKRKISQAKHFVSPAKRWARRATASFDNRKSGSVARSEYHVAGERRLAAGGGLCAVGQQRLAAVADDRPAAVSPDDVAHEAQSGQVVPRANREDAAPWRNQARPACADTIR